LKAASDLFVRKITPPSGPGMRHPRALPFIGGRRYVKYVKREVALLRQALFAVDAPLKGACDECGDSVLRGIRETRNHAELSGG